ncbi:hypothetical protein BJV78DRAFT_693656 [Lactifluus subvellereus]|nr:hypothetical protein BJV78DRAFT_693656 [Lactifluus subvellereus]
MALPRIVVIINTPPGCRAICMQQNLLLLRMVDLGVTPTHAGWPVVHSTWRSPGRVACCISCVRHCLACTTRSWRTPLRPLSPSRGTRDARGSLLYSARVASPSQGFSECRNRRRRLMDEKIASASSLRRIRIVSRISSDSTSGPAKSLAMTRNPPRGKSVTLGNVNSMDAAGPREVDAQKRQGLA